MKRTSCLGAVGLFAAASALAAFTTPADAAGRPAGAPGPVAHATGADSRAGQDAVRAFWTSARLTQATPRGQVRPLARPGGGGKPSTSDPSLGTEWTAGRVTVGKAFFELGGGLYVCSGNAVDDAHDAVTVTNLVVTAGHCVNDGDTRFVTNFLFIPQYDASKPRTSDQPHGTFAATRLYTTAEWAAQGADRFDYDVGVALVGPNEREVPLTTALGDSSDIGFVVGDPDNRADIDYTIATHAFGYPQARPYDGTKLVACWGSTTADTTGGSSDYRLRCNMTGGSSGGPWLLDATAVDPAFPIDNSDVSDVQVSVNSFGYLGEKNAMYGPVFGATVKALHDAAVAGR